MKQEQCPACSGTCVIPDSTRPYNEAKGDIEWADCPLCLATGQFRRRDFHVSHDGAWMETFYDIKSPDYLNAYMTMFGIKHDSKRKEIWIDKLDTGLKSVSFERGSRKFIPVKGQAVRKLMIVSGFQHDIMPLHKGVPHNWNWVNNLRHMENANE